LFGSNRWYLNGFSTSSSFMRTFKFLLRVALCFSLSVLIETNQ
jgi:hypothetical protein